MKKTTKLIYLVILATILNITPLSARAATNIIGFITSWRGDASGTNYPYSKVTHINYAFAQPDAQGNIPGFFTAGTPSDSKLKSIVLKAHARNVKVSISVGGGGFPTSVFTSIASNATYTTNFINSIKTIINSYQLDGVDIDWEFPATSADASNFQALMSQVYNSLHPLGKLVTADVGAESWYATYINTNVQNSVDWLNLMTYRKRNPHINIGFISSYYDKLGQVEFWGPIITGTTTAPVTPPLAPISPVSPVEGVARRNFPYSKLAVGIEFAGQDLKYWYNYADIVNWSGQTINPNQDFFTVTTSGNIWTTVQFNGVGTVKNIAKYAQIRGLAGVMFWEADQDAYNNATYSLVGAICSVIKTSC